MTGSAGASCFTGLGADQHMCFAASNAPWDDPSWAFTATFKTGAIDGSTLAFRVTDSNDAGITLARAKMGISSGNGYLTTRTTSVPFTWAANTWYSVKWTVIWGDQERIKVWPVSGSEPASWLVAGSALAHVQDCLMVNWDSAIGPNSVSVDDFAFGPAPVLPSLPPPPNTEFNPPYVNSDDAGDPVSTFTGAYSDSHLDITIPGRGPAVQFSRAYNSNDTRVTTLGPGWTHTYNIRLTSPGDGSSDIVLVGPEAGATGISKQVESSRHRRASIEL